jgi:hypothetical protein
MGNMSPQSQRPQVPYDVTASQQSVISHVTGQTKRKTDAIGLLIEMGMLIADGSPRALTLAGEDAVNLYTLGRANGKGMI